MMALGSAKYSSCVSGISRQLTVASAFRHRRREDDFNCYRKYSRASRSHYDTLGITPKASQAQVKASYYKLSKQYHPDVNKTLDAKEKFRDIAEAYETLRNKAKRRDYDHHQSGRPHFGGFTSSEVTDVEYQEFVKKHGVFKKKGNAPTGRTNIYDFDEFYKMHYGDAIKQKKASNEAKEKLNSEMKERPKVSKRLTVVYGIIMFTFASFIFRTHHKS